MNDFLSWVKEAFNSRFWSTMYGTFILARLTTNWKFWFVSFFIEEKFILGKYYLLKNEYLVSLYSLSSFWCWIRTVSKLILIPAIVTYLVHWRLSKIETRVYEKWLSNKTERKIIKAKEEKKYQKTVEELEKKKSGVLQIQEKNLKRAIKIKRQEKQVRSEEEIWLDEYEELSKNNEFIGAMNELNNSLYSENWKIKDPFRSNIIYISNNSLAILDTNWLIDINQIDDKVSSTKKWKFFMKKFINYIGI